MKMVGILAVCLTGIGLVILLAMLVTSAPDIKRYLKMRAM